jgi:hypothetical protein
VGGVAVAGFHLPRIWPLFVKNMTCLDQITPQPTVSPAPKNGHSVWNSTPPVQKLPLSLRYPQDEPWGDSQLCSKQLPSSPRKPYLLLDPPGKLKKGIAFSLTPILIVLSMISVRYMVKPWCKAAVAKLIQMCLPANCFLYDNLQVGIVMW